MQTPQRYDARLKSAAPAGSGDSHDCRWRGHLPSRSQQGPTFCGKKMLVHGHENHFRLFKCTSGTSLEIQDDSYASVFKFYSPQSHNRSVKIVKLFFLSLPVSCLST